jgi:hypothetical protein
VVASRVDSYCTRLVLVGHLLGVRREEVELNTPDGEDTNFSPGDSESLAQRVHQCHHHRAKLVMTYKY